MTNTTIYHCTDGNAEVEYTAESPRDAAQAYVDDGGWGEITETTWVTVYVWTEDGDDPDDREGYTIEIDPAEPGCTGDDHDWQSPHEIVGGIAENPGVWGHGGGCRIHEVCRHCGAHRHTDTWAQRPDTGEQGLTSVRYEPPDHESLAWADGQAI